MINGSIFHSYVKLPEGLRSIPEDGLERSRSRQICDPAMGHPMKFSGNLHLLDGLWNTWV